MQKKIRKTFLFGDNCVRIGCVKYVSIKKRIPLISSQCVNKQL